MCVFPGRVLGDVRAAGRKGRARRGVRAVLYGRACRVTLEAAVTYRIDGVDVAVGLRLLAFCFISL